MSAWVKSYVSGRLPRRSLGRAGARVAGDEIRVVVTLAAPAGPDPDAFGNRTDAGVLSLPVGERDQRRRVGTVERGMAEARRERAGLHNLDFLLRVAGIGGRALLGAGLAARRPQGPWRADSLRRPRWRAAGRAEARPYSAKRPT